MVYPPAVWGSNDSDRLEQPTDHLAGSPVHAITNPDGSTSLVGAGGLATPFLSPTNAIRKPQLKHFFACDRLSGGGLVDVVGGLTLTPASAVLSVVAPEYVTVAAASSGNLTLSGSFQLAGNKPFFVMALYTLNATGIGLAGFHFSTADANVGQLELWGLSASSASLIGNGSNVISELETPYADGAGRTDIAVGMLVEPGIGVDFFYVGPSSFWETSNQPWSGGVGSVIKPITTTCQPIANTTNGVRKIHGFIMYEFDSKPTDWKAAAIEMRTNWLAGIKIPYSGW